MSEREVGKVAVGGLTERIVGQPVAEEGVGLGSGVVVPGS